MKTQFGPFVFDRTDQLLARDGQEIPLPPRVLGVLDVLTARPGQIVSKQQLIETVWKDAFVSDTSLAEAISFLRQALGDDPQQPRYIQTVHRRGYRFLPASLDPVPPVPGADLPPAARDVWLLVLPWSIAVLLAAIAVTAVWRLAHPDAPLVPPVARFDVAAPAGTTIGGTGAAVSISADGSRVAFVACGTDGCRVFARRLDDTESRAVPGTDGADAPFLSPDGGTLGFFADGKLKTVPVAGGTPVALADVRQPLGAAWSGADTIVFAAGAHGGLGGLMRVPADGSRPPVSVYDGDARRGEVALAWPDVMPGGRVILATSLGALDQPPLASIVAIAPGTGARTAIVDRAAAARFVAPDTLVFVRDGQLTAAAFDPSQLKIVGQPVALGARVSEQAPHFAVSRVGSAVLAAPASGAGDSLAFASRDGRVVSLPSSVQQLTSPSVSPDGRRIIALAHDAFRSDIWSYDIDRGALTRVTFGGEHRAPIWNADGRSVVFASRIGGVFNLFERTFDGSAPARIAIAGHHRIPSAASNDGGVVYTEFEADTGEDLWTMPIAGGEATALVRTPFDETGGALSPDGRWLAYQSNESNRWDVYARALPVRGAVTAISTAGGTSPVWSRDGRTIFYSGPEGLMAVDVLREGCTEGESSCDPAPSRPVRILPGAWLPRGTTPDGRVLVERRRDRDPADHLVVTLQWTRELQRLVPPAVVSSPK